MSISSIDSSMLGLISQYYYPSSVSTTSSISSNNKSSNDTRLSGVAAVNTDGDTLQLSGTTTPAILSTANIYSNMDTDGDGSVSESEFAALRPSDVTEEMASNLYSSFDTNSSGSLTESEFAAAMNNALAIHTVSAASSVTNTSATQSVSGGAQSASNSCPLGNTTCLGCGQCGQTTQSLAGFNVSPAQNTSNNQPNTSADYFTAIATKAYESNSIYL